MKEFVVKLSNGKVSYERGPVRGLCAHTPTIYINDPKNDQETLDDIIHETMHHMFPKMTHANVYRAADDLSCVLWLAGYRLKRRRPTARKTRQTAKRAHPRRPQHRAQPQDHADAARAFSALAPPLTARDALKVHKDDRACVLQSRCRDMSPSERAAHQFIFNTVEPDFND